MLKKIVMTMKWIINQTYVKHHVSLELDYVEFQNKSLVSSQESDQRSNEFSNQTAQ